MRVLLIDDNDGIRQLLRRLLSGSGCCEVVGEARDGSEAVSAAAEHRPDLVVMDSKMPGEDGVVATRRLKQVFPDVEVVALVAVETPELRAAFEGAGAGAFFGKADLARLVDHIVKSAGRGTPLLSI